MTITSITHSVRSLLKSERIQDKYDTNTLSHRLKLCLHYTKMSQSDLARLINVKPQVIQYLCTKNVKSSRFTFELAEALNIDYTWLSTGEGTMYPVIKSQSTENKIPLYDWRSLDTLETDTGMTVSPYEKYIFTAIESDSPLIATILDDISMEPRFDRGTTLIIECNKQVKEQDFVLVKLAESQFWIFRQLILNEKQQLMLSSSNKNLFKDIDLKPEDLIMGRLVQSISHFQR